MKIARSSKVILAVFLTLCNFVLLNQQPAISGPSQAGATNTAKTFKCKIEPFAAIYNVHDHSGAAFKQYVWSDGKGKFRIENQLPYAKIDGITDVTFEDYPQHKRYVANTNFQTVEVHPMGELDVPVTDREFVSRLKARCIGQKTIAGIKCKGWRYANNEVWVSPELGWYLEYHSKTEQGLVSCSAQKVDHRSQTAETFALPGKFKHVNFNQTTHRHSHSH